MLYLENVLLESLPKKDSEGILERADYRKHFSNKL